MTKFKLSYYILLFLVILGTPVKNVYLKELNVIEDTHTYNNYYFFIEPYNYKDMNKNMDETINYGLFAPPRLGHFGDNVDFVVLEKSGEIDDDVIDTYYEFYGKKNEQHRTSSSSNYIDIGEVDAQNNKKYCLISSNEKTKDNHTDIYYIHSCYKNENDTTWSGYYIKDKENKYCYEGKCNEDNNSSEQDSNIFLEKSCASINRFSNMKIDSSKDSSIIRDGTNKKYDVFKIVRPKIDISSEEPTDFTKVKIGDKFDNGKNNTSCPDENEHVVNPTTSGYMYSPVLVKFSYEVTNYKCENKNFYKNVNCNASNKIEQTCSKETIEIGNSVTSESVRAEFSFSQSGVISNVLTPSEIYQGGGVKLGFTYYNTFEWQYLSDTLKFGANIEENTAKDKLLSAIKSKIKDVDSIRNGLTVEFNLDSIEKFDNIKSNMVKECTQTFSGDFKSGKVTTICTVFLPVTNVQIYTGKINGVTASTGSGINNKMYTKLDFTGTLNFSAIVSGLNVIKEGSDWSINYNPDKNDKSCQVEVYSRLYKKKNPGDKTNKFKFVYRPIDLDNPFPNRLAGANWYNWYSKDVNKERLENSYSKLQYRVELNPSRVNEIKKYNNGKKYFDWDGFDENGKSDFINNSDFKEYFPIKGQNIVGDSS